VKQHADNSVFELDAYFPDAITEVTHQGHTKGPTQLNRFDVFANDFAFDGWQTL